MMRHDALSHTQLGHTVTAVTSILQCTDMYSLFHRHPREQQLGKNSKTADTNSFHGHLNRDLKVENESRAQAQ